MGVHARTLIGFAAMALLGLTPQLATAESVMHDGKSFEIMDGGIAMSFTGQPGNPDSGRKVIIDRKLGNCLACHQMSTIPEQQYHGEVAPELDGVADRYSEAELRLLLADAKQVYPETLMPAFLRVDGYNRVLDKFAGKSILTGQQVEDVIAYLLTLKE